MSRVRRRVSKPSKAKEKKKRTRLLKGGHKPESVIQAEILDWLQTTGLMCWRSNSGEIFLRGRRINLGPIGCADISMVLPTHGTFVGLEVKSAKGKLRKAQIEYCAALTEAGGRYFVVRSVADAKVAVAECLGASVWQSVLDRTRGCTGS